MFGSKIFIAINVSFEKSCGAWQQSEQHYTHFHSFPACGTHLFQPEASVSSLWQLMHRSREQRTLTKAPSPGIA